MADLGDLLDQSANLRTLAPAAVGTQVGLMSIISVVTILIFNVLRPKNKIVYEPKVKYHVGNKKPPRISDSIFGWVSPLIHTKEPELVEKVGLDAAVFLRFLRMLRWLFTGIAVLTCGVLLPINITYNLKHVDKDSRDVLSMLTIRDVETRILFAHVTVTYLVSFLTMACVWWNWKQVIRLRKQWFRSPEYVQSFYARTLMLMDVPKRMQSDEGIRAIFDSVNAPYPTTSVHVGRQVGKLPELIEYHNDTVRELERALVKYLKDGKIGKKRPTIRVGGTGCCGGEEKDAIDYYTAKLQRTERAVEEYRAQIDIRRAENYGFASMAAVPYAHIVANLLRRKRVKGATITLAPNPKDLIWENLNKSTAELNGKRMTGWIFLILVCFFNTVPLFIISILANLASLTTFVPFLQTWSDDSPATFTFISGVLPPAVSAFFSFFLPIIMRWLSQYMGSTTHSKLDRSVVARYFAFLVISQLVVFTLIGVIFNSVKEIIREIGKHKSFEDILQNVNKLPATINRTYIDQSSYWLTYFPLRGFLVLFDLAQIINLVWIFIKKHLFGRTPRDIREWTQPPEFQYSVYYSNTLFMATVGFVFAPLAPLVVVAAAIVFWVSSGVYKYQLMFVFVSKIESGGRLWNVIINRLLVGVILMQLLMVLTILLQLGFDSLNWIATLPPIVILVIFKLYINRAFIPDFTFYIPTQDELRMAQVHSGRADNIGNRLEKRFAHPSMHAELFTPMVHANMSALLPQVYSGKIASTQTKLDEFGGSKMDTKVVAGGIKIAGIEQSDLEYDPALYQRDRGELDWDTRSVSSANLLAMDNKSALYAPSITGRASPAPSKAAYDRYLAQGTQSDIEMTRFDGSDQLPLLTSQQAPGYFDAMNRSTASLPYGGSPEVPGVPSLPMAAPQPYREAPVHRPYPTRELTGSPGPYQAYGQYPPQQPQQYTPPQPQQYSPQQQQQQRSPGEGYEQNMAGRGTFRR
ncbi:hypothetical protein QCA50_020277 [Cerrena zonata]|uniref:DUF221-domain-containing protein n=1 Tax=Cerrena zonata TaxID=2478898 RepID=A0AAW0FC23_9APHY